MGAPVSIRILLGLLLGVSGPAAAQVPEDLACVTFSPDPLDRSGKPIHFSATLWDGPQRAPTSSKATGKAEFTLERDPLRIRWKVTFQNLTSEPTALHVHGPVPAEGLAPVLFPLTADSFRQPITGEREISMGEAAFFLQNAVYVNIHTVRYPEGEIRGTLKKMRPTC
jgi:hypothetical protein